MAEIVHHLLGDARNVPGRRFLLQEKGGKLPGAQVGCAFVPNPLLHCWPIDDAEVRSIGMFAIGRLAQGCR